MSLATWNELTPGCVNLEAGNSLKNFAGSPRSGPKPIFNQENCIHCFFCWVFCPENAIIVEQEEVVGINTDYCKRCGICENECPVQKEPRPIVLVEEANEL